MTTIATTRSKPVDPLVALLSEIREIKGRMDIGNLSDAETDAATYALARADERIITTRASTREGAEMAARAVRFELEEFILDDGVPGAAVVRALLASFDAFDGPTAARPQRKPPAEDDTGYLTSHDAAALLRKSVATLAGWRSRGRGPRYSKIGGAILYDPTDLKAFVAGKRRQGTRDPEAL